MTPYRNLMLALLATTIMAPVTGFAAGGKDRADMLTQEAESVPVAEAIDPALMTAEETIVTTQDGATQARAISLSDALRFAYESNPTLRAARTELLATQELLPQAQAGWKPSAEVTGDVTHYDIDSDGTGGDADGTEKNLGAQITQPLYRGGRTVAGTSSARNVIMAQRAFLMATEQDILLQVVTAYMNVLRDQTLYDLAVNNQNVIGRQLDASRARFEVGDVTRTDVSQSEARQAGAEANRVAALGNLRASRAVFRQVVGLDAGSLIAPQQTLPLPTQLDEAVRMSEQYNPPILAAQFLHNAAEKDIDTVFGELLPSVGLFATWNEAMDPSPGSIDDRSTKTFGVSASMPLYEAGGTRSRVRQAKTTASQRRIEVEEATRLAHQRTVTNWEILAAAQSEILSRRAQVEANRIARDGVQKEAELGTRTILDSLNADQELLDAESALITAQRNEVVARYALAATVGLLNPDVLGFPELERDYNQHIDEITGKIFSTSTTYGRDLTGDRR